MSDTLYNYPNLLNIFGGTLNTLVHYLNNMIHTLLTTLADRMNEFLHSYYERAEIMVEAGAIDTTSSDEQADKIIVTLFSIERETAMGISGSYKTSSSTVSHQAPPWHLNIHVMIAAVFSPQRYMESLKVISDCISFLQQNSTLLLPDGQKITLEPVTLSTQELSNTWSILGGHYYPSILCKARMLTYDGNEIKHTGRRISHEKLN